MIHQQFDLHNGVQIYSANAQCPPQLFLPGWPSRYMCYVPSPSRGSFTATTKMLQLHTLLGLQTERLHSFPCQAGLQSSNVQTQLWQGFKKNDLHVPISVAKKRLLETKHKNWQLQSQVNTLITTYDDASAAIKQGHNMKRAAIRQGRIHSQI